jgi:hypothetical protein
MACLNFAIGYVLDIKTMFSSRWLPHLILTIISSLVIVRMEIMNLADYWPTIVRGITGIDEEIPTLHVCLKTDYGRLAGQCYTSFDTDRVRIVSVASIVHSGESNTQIV